jgi:hypothetical protein
MNNLYDVINKPKEAICSDDIALNSLHYSISRIKDVRRKPYNDNYIYRRNNMISSLKSFISKFNLTNTIYYSTISLVDTISQEYYYMNHALVIIACCMLSSN